MLRTGFCRRSSWPARRLKIGLEQEFAVKKLDLRTYVYYRNNLDSLTAKFKTTEAIGN
jgi:hypothetical protein